jgi:hypothetical protein
VGKIVNGGFAYLAMLALSGIPLSTALAMPPLSQRAAHVDSRPALDSRPASDARPPLDLRSPLELHAVAAAMVISEKRADAFPSYSMHRPMLAGEAQESVGTSAMESLGAQSRMESPMQALAHRVHREGLPVARLWENRSALVSLGLNQKGKPGLWIIQKIH